MNECQHSNLNLAEVCNCTYQGCPRKGICCECLHYHRKMNQLPACYFDAEAEKTYDRSIRHFVSLNKKK